MNFETTFELIGLYFNILLVRVNGHFGQSESEDSCTTPGVLRRIHATLPSAKEALF